MRKLAEKVFRIGVQALWIDDDGNHWVTIKNRSYKSQVQITPEKIEIWKKILRTNNGRHKESN
jgi:hypothetical protein